MKTRIPSTDRRDQNLKSTAPLQWGREHALAETHSGRYGCERSRFNGFKPKSPALTKAQQWRLLRLIWRLRRNICVLIVLCRV